MLEINNRVVHINNIIEAIKAIRNLPIEITSTIDAAGNDIQRIKLGITLKEAKDLVVTIVKLYPKYADDIEKGIVR
jgi:hypothetical protein